MKILHIIPTYKPAFVYGGPIFSVSLICENLVKNGHEVLMLTTTANGEEELDVPTGKIQIVDGVPTIYYKRWTKDHTHLSPGLIWNVFVRCKKYDAVHIHAWWNIPVVFSVIACWLRGVKPILSPRGMLSDFSFEKNHASGKAFFHKYVGKFLLKKTTLHLTAEAEKKECEHIGADSFVLPNYVQLAELTDKPIDDEKKDTFSLLFLSRIHAKKNIENLFRALEKVEFNYELKIAGMGEGIYLSELKKLAALLNIESKIKWLGEIHGEEKFKTYATADLFILPSFNENFANVIIEAMSAGTPVLVSKYVGLSDYVKRNNLGWICGTGVDEIKATLNNINAEKNKLESKGKAAALQVQQDFSTASLTRRYVEKYTEFLN